MAAISYLSNHSGVATLQPSVKPTDGRAGADPHDLLTISHVLTESLIVACIVVLSVCVLIIMSSRARLYHNCFNQFLASLSLGTLVFSLLVRPGTIHEEIRGSKLTRGYCGLYLVLLDLEWIFLPYTLLFLTAERILAVRDPLHYADKMRKPVRICLLAVPWAFGAFFGIIRNFAMNEEIEDSAARGGAHKNPGHLAQLGCYVVADKDIRNLQVLLGEIVANVLPILAITIANLTLLISFCRRRQRAAQPTAMQTTDLDAPHVNGESIILTSVADVAMVIVLIDDVAEMTSIGPWVVTHWLFSAVEVLILIMAVTLQPDIRSAISRLCCCYDVRDEYRSLINVNTGTQTGAANRSNIARTNNNNATNNANDNANNDATVSPAPLTSPAEAIPNDNAV